MRQGKYAADKRGYSKYIFSGILFFIVAAIIYIVCISGNFLTSKSNNVVGMSPKSKKTKTVKTNDDSLLTLVNKDNPLPEDWSIELVELYNNNAVAKSAYADLQKMLDDARALGHDPLICSSYRSHEKQLELFNNEVQTYIEKGYSDEEAEKLAEKWVAVPGTSEHELGLAVDIVSVSNQRLDSSQEDTQTQEWLMKNCWKYGFILRYPDDKTDITGVEYEPWHYRYVGRKNARKIRNQGVCLEEFLSIE